MFIATAFFKNMGGGIICILNFMNDYIGCNFFMREV